MSPSSVPQGKRALSNTAKDLQISKLRLRIDKKVKKEKTFEAEMIPDLPSRSRQSREGLKSPGTLHRAPGCIERGLYPAPKHSFKPPKNRVGRERAPRAKVCDSLGAFATPSPGQSSKGAARANLDESSRGEVNRRKPYFIGGAESMSIVHFHGARHCH